MGVETMVSHVPEEKLKQLDKDLERRQDNVSTKYLTGTIIPIIDNIRKLINDDQGLEVLCSLAHIVDANVPIMDSYAQALG